MTHLVEEASTICPYCLRSVAYKWRAGFIAEPHNVLIADIVLHVECWEAALNNEPVKELQDDSQSR